MLTAEEMVERIQSEEFILDYRYREVRKAVENATCEKNASLFDMDRLRLRHERLDVIRGLMADMQIDPLSDEEKRRRWANMQEVQRLVLGKSYGGGDGVGKQGGE